MQIGIIGLPNSGKTTIFNALTGSDTATEAFSSGQVEVHTAVVKVPDERVDTLSAMFNPEKTTYAQVTFNDIAGFGKGAAKSGLAGPLLNAIAANDALLLVVRAFEDENVPHPEDTVDPARDVELMAGELMLSDMAVIDRRLERLATMKNRGTPEERKAMGAEEALLQRLMAALEDETALRDVALTDAERKSLGGFGLMSLKPLLMIINGGDEDDEAGLADLLNARAIFLRGRLEAELAQMDPEEAAEFLTDFGIEEPGLNRAIRLSYDMLNRQTFFTVGEDEVRAWTVRRGANAPEAAGAIHSDLQKGFIRAEVIGYDELIEAGGMAEARKLGKLRLEGKEYPVKDGDVVSIRFNL
jgi:GTP-binding protein YchF